MRGAQISGGIVCVAEPGFELLGGGSCWREGEGEGVRERGSEVEESVVEEGGIVGVVEGV